MDIVDSIITAGDAAIDAAAYIEAHKNGHAAQVPADEEMEFAHA
jgi:hypothetical protein